MFALMGANLWQQFSRWVSLTWTQTTYIIVLCVFTILGLMAILSFFKKSINKDKKPKWGMLVIAILMFALVAVVSAARFV